MNNTGYSPSAPLREKPLQFYSNVGFNIFMTLTTGDCLQHIAIYIAVWTNMATVGEKGNDTRKFKPFCKTLFTVLSQLSPVTYPLDRIGRILSTDECSKKHFYLLLNSEIDGKLAKLLDKSHGRIPFYKGKSKFFLHRKGWKVSKNGPADGGMIRNLNTIVRSGIYNFVHHREYRNTKNLTEKHNAMTQGYKEHNLKYSAISFYLYFICLGVSILVLLGERIINGVMA
jgi:hypothetical protein